MELTQLTFAVDTTPLDTADKKIRGLGEALKTLERPMSTIAKDSSTVASGVEEIGKSTDAAAKGLDKVERNAIKLADTLRFYRGEIVEVNNEQVALGANFTKTQSAFLAYNKLIGATSDQLKRIAKEFMDLNAMTSANTFDNQIKGISILTKQIEEHRKVQELAASGISLTKDQIVNLVRETNRLEQSMKSMGVSTEEATEYIKEQTNSYIAKAKELNSLIEISNRSEQQAKAEARANADALEQAKKLSDYRMQNWASSVGSTSTELSSMKDHYQKAEREAADFYATMEAASNSYRSSFIANQEAEIKQMEKRKKMWQDLYGADNAAAIKEEEDAVKRLTAAENARMKNWAESVGMKSTELTEMSSYYSKQEQDAKSFYSAMQSASDSYRANFIANQEAEIKEMEKRKRMWKDLYGEDHAAAIRAEADAVKQLADANTYTASKMEQLRAQVSGLEKGLTTASSNALYQFEKNLKATGVAADVAEKQVAEFTALLKRKQDAPSAFKEMSKSVDQMSKQVNHLARDVSVQLGDIAISLAGGQNPFMVMIQQGDQIRGALLRAKDQGVDTSQAMRDALSTMSNSFVDLGKMVGTFFVGSIESAGNAVKRLVTEKTFLGAAIDTVNAKMIAQGGVSANLASYIQKLGTLFTYLTGTAIVGATLALTTFTVAQLAVIKESDNLVRSIHSQGAAFGVSSEEANKMITSLSSVGVSSSKAAQAMQAMIEGGKQSKESFALVAEAATLMSTYAGISIDKTVKEFDKIADAPSKSLIELGKATGYVTLEMVQEVQQLEKVGATQEAVRRATEILAEAKKKAAGDIARDLSAVATAWIEIKTAIQAGFDAFKNSTVAEGTMKALATIAKELAFAIYGIGTAVRVVKTLLGSFPEIGKNLDAISADVKAFRASLDAAAPSVGGLTAEQKQFNDQQLAGAEATEKLNKAISGGAKDNVKSMTQGAYVAARMTEELQKAGQGAVYSAELQKTAVAKFKKEYEELTKVKSGPKGSKPKETFSIATDNTIAETKKSLDTQLKLVKEFENNRRDALKNAYESGLISRGEYLAQETAMTIDAFESQQQVIDKYQQYLDSFNQRRINVIKSYDDAVAKGGNKQELAKQLSNELANLDRAANGASETLDAMRASLSAATDKRFTESWKESNKALMESKKAYEEFESTVNNANQERQSEIQLQIQLSSAHGAEAEAIKASTAAMKSYAPAINKMALELRKAQQEYDNFMKSIDYSDDSKFEAQMLDADRLQKNLAQQRTNYNNAVAKARQDSEQAATDASTKYQIEKYNELKGTLSDSIYTAIFEGGKKGGDVLKNYLMKEFKNFVITVFIQPVIGSALGSLGISAADAVAGASSSSSGGGGGGVMGTIGNVISTGSTVMKMLTNPMVLGNQMAQGVVAVGDALFKAGIEQMGNAVTGWASTANASAILGSIGSSVGGYGVSKLIGNGYKTGLGNAVDIAGAIGSYFFGPIAGVVSGTVNRAFGRKLKDTGIEGTFSNTGFEGQNYQFYKGGWLRSDKTTYSEMDQTMENLLSYQFKRLQLETAVLATSIGAGVDSIKDYTKKIKVSFKGLDEKQINEKLTEVYTEISNEMAAGVLRSLVKSSEPAKFEGLNIQENILGIEFTKLSQLEASVAVWNKSIETGFDAAGNKLSEGWIRKLGDAVNQANDILDSQTEKLIEGYQWFGETFSETLNRLSSSITIVNESFKDLGYTLMDVSLEGASKASDIISLFGGEDQYVQATGYFYENAYTQEEKAANLTNRLSEALGRVNEKLPDSISGYRDLVDAYAKQGDAGREVWASLVQLFPAFEQLNNLNEELANSFNDLLGNYYEKFGTETEKVAFQTKLLKEALSEVGLELPKNREEYMLQVQAYKALGKSGEKALSVLLQSADAFDALFPSVKDALSNSLQKLLPEKALESEAQKSLNVVNNSIKDFGLSTMELADVAELSDSQLYGLAQTVASFGDVSESTRVSVINSLTALSEYNKVMQTRAATDRRLELQESRALMQANSVKFASEEDSKKISDYLTRTIDEATKKAREKFQTELEKSQESYEKSIYPGMDLFSETALISLQDKYIRDEQAYTAFGQFERDMQIWRLSTIDHFGRVEEGLAKQLIPAIELQESLTKSLRDSQPREVQRKAILEDMPDIGYYGYVTNKQLQQEIWDIEDAKPFIEERKQLEQSLIEVQRESTLTLGDQSKAQEILNEINKKSVEGLNAVELAQYNLNKTIKEQTDFIRKQIDIFNLLKDAISELTGEFSANLDYDKSRRIISEASKTGTLPDEKILSSAVTSALSGIKSKVFSSEFEKAISTAVLLGEITKLSNIASSNIQSAFGSTSVDGVPKQGFALGGYTGVGSVYEPAGVVHKGEFVFNQQDVANFGGPGNLQAIRSGNFSSTDNSELLDELRSLRAEVVMLRAEARSTAISSDKTAKILDRVTPEKTSIAVSSVS